MIDRVFVRHPLAALAGGAAVISLAPILVKAIGLSGLGPTAIAFWRCLLGAALLFSLARLRRTGVVPRRDVMWLTAASGLAFAVDLFVWHRSIVLAGAGMATILGNTQVFATAVFSAVLFQERLSARFVVAAVSAMGGVVLLVGVGSEVQFTPAYTAGIAYGLVTGIVYAVFLVCLRLVGRRDPDGSTVVRLAWLSSYAALFLASFLVAERGPAMPPDVRSWSFLLLLALIAQSLGWWVISKSLVRVEGPVGGLVLLLQPVLATLWGVIVFSERLTGLQIVGAAITLGAIYAGSAARRASTPS